MDCTLCDTYLDKKADEYYFICNTCGAYVKDRKYYISDKEEKEEYELHNNDIEDAGYQNFTAPITHAILAKYSGSHLGLDYGCGNGPVITKQLTDAGLKVNLYDPYFYPDETYKTFQYDYIFCCEVFEHFYQPKKEIEKLLDLLKPNGDLLIMTLLYNTDINFSKWFYRNDSTHVFIYTRKTIEYIVAKYNLKLEALNKRLVILQKGA